MRIKSCPLILAIFSTNFMILMIARIFQAVGNGILTSMAQVIILSIYPKEESGSVMGLYGLSVGAAPVIAPTIAGIIVDHIGWKMIFALALMIMTFSLVLAVYIFDNILDTVKQKFDVISFLLSAFAYTGIILGMGNIGNYSVFSVNILLPVLFGILTMIIFVYRQLHGDLAELKFKIRLMEQQFLHHLEQ